MEQLNSEQILKIPNEMTVAMIRIFVRTAIGLLLFDHFWSLPAEYCELNL